MKNKRIVVIDRIELLFNGSMHALVDVVSQDIGAVSPKTAVVPRHIDIDDPWDFRQPVAAIADTRLEQLLGTDAASRTTPTA